jgi:hypothetical protein
MNRSPVAPACLVLVAFGARAAVADSAVTLVPDDKATAGVALEKVPDYSCPLPEPADTDSACDGSVDDVLADKKIGSYGRITVHAVREADTHPTPDRCLAQKILLVGERPGETSYWVLDIPGGREITWTVRRLAQVSAGKQRLLWLELEGTSDAAPIRSAFVFGVAGGKVAELVSALPLVRARDDGTPAQINVDFPSPTTMRVAARTAAVTDEQKKWLGDRPLSPTPKSEGQAIDMRIDYPDVDICAREQLGYGHSSFSADPPRRTAHFGNVSVHTVGQGPLDFSHVDSYFLVAEGKGGGSVIPIDHTVTSHSVEEGLAVHRLEEISGGERQFLWLEADVCHHEREGADWSAQSCDRRGYLLDRDAKGLLRYQAYGVPLIEGAKSNKVKNTIDVQLPDAHTLAITSKAQKLSANQKKWLGAHVLP